MWMYLIYQLHTDYFDILTKVGNNANCLFVIHLCQFLVHIYILILVMFYFLWDEICYFVVFQL